MQLLLKRFLIKKLQRRPIAEAYRNKKTNFKNAAILARRDVTAASTANHVSRRVLTDVVVRCI